MGDRIEVVSAVIVRHDGRMLLTQRDPMRSDFGYAWESPGGKVDPGETHEQALTRELGEELGIEAIVGGKLKSFDFDPPILLRPVRVTFYRIDRSHYTPKPLQSIGIGWFKPEDMAHLYMPPANVAFRAELAILIREACR